MTIDLTLTPEQTQLQQTARDFAVDEIQPLVKKLDESDNLFPWELCKDVFDQGAKLGFTSLLLPQELGGGGKKCIDFAIVQEELGADELVRRLKVSCIVFTGGSSVSSPIRVGRFRTFHRFAFSILDAGSHSPSHGPG